jgi:hypothetical protein
MYVRKPVKVTDEKEKHTKIKDRRTDRQLGIPSRFSHVMTNDRFTSTTLSPKFL